MKQEVLNNQILTISNWVSQSANAASEALFAGGKLSIDWVCIGSTKEGVLLSAGLNTLSLLAAESFFPKSETHPYYKPLFVVAALALSVAVTPTIGYYFHWKVSYVAALKMAALNLSLKVAVFALYEHCFFYKDKDKLLEAIGKDPYALKLASSSLADDKEIVLEAVKKDGCALDYASEKFRGDEEIVLAAVKNDGYALYYASEKLRNDEEFVLEAIEESGSALKYASEELRGDKEFICKR